MLKQNDCHREWFRTGIQTREPTISRLRLRASRLGIPPKEKVGVAQTSAFMGKAVEETGVTNLGVPFALTETHRDFWVGGELPGRLLDDTRGGCEEAEATFNLLRVIHDGSVETEDKGSREVMPDRRTEWAETTQPAVSSRTSNSAPIPTG